MGQQPITAAHSVPPAAHLSALSNSFSAAAQAASAEGPAFALLLDPLVADSAMPAELTDAAAAAFFLRAMDCCLESTTIPCVLRPGSRSSTSLPGLPASRFLPYVSRHWAQGEGSLKGRSNSGQW